MPRVRHRIPQSQQPGSGSASQAPGDDAPFDATLELVASQLAQLQELQQTLQQTRNEWHESSRGHRQRELRLQMQRRRLGEQIQQFRDLRRRQRSLAARREHLNSAAQAEIDLLKGQLADATAMLERTRDRLRECEADHRREIQDLGEQFDKQFEESEKYRSEARRLAHQLEELQASIEVVPEEEDFEIEAALREVESWKKRCDSLEDDLKELEEENARLVLELSSAQQAARSAPPAAAARPAMEAMTWEQRKAAILEQLIREDDPSYTPQERETLREKVEATDLEIRRRDDEIRNLRQMLEEKKELRQEVDEEDESLVVGASGLAQLIDADALISEERRKLEAVRAEWEEKLRQAEVELSLERAKIARERREMEMRQTELEERMANVREQEQLRPPEENATEPKRRWLKHLGLGEGN